MKKHLLPSIFSLLAVLGLVGLTLAPASARAEEAPPAPGRDGGPFPTRSGMEIDNALLAKVSALYYSTSRSRLQGFDCAVHPLWRALFESADKNSPLSIHDPRILLLNSVAITLHARMRGGSTLEWTEPGTADEPLDADSKKLLDRMHDATDKTVMGFAQVWTSFVNGSLVPVSSQGLEIVANGDGGYEIHSREGDISMTEVFDRDLVLQQYNGQVRGIAVNSSPAYRPTSDGLLVTSFLTQILPAGGAPEQAQKMRVSIGYQTVDGFYLPARLNVELVDTARFDFVLDDCTTTRDADQRASGKTETE